MSLRMPTNAWYEEAYGTDTGSTAGRGRASMSARHLRSVLNNMHGHTNDTPHTLGGKPLGPPQARSRDKHGADHGSQNEGGGDERGKPQ